MIKRKHTKPNETQLKSSWQCRCGAINEAFSTECKQILTEKIHLIQLQEKAIRKHFSSKESYEIQKEKNRLRNQSNRAKERHKVLNDPAVVEAQEKLSVSNKFAEGFVARFHKWDDTEKDK